MLKKKKENLPSSHTSNKKKRNYFATRKNVGPTSIEKGPRTYERAAILQSLCQSPHFANTYPEAKTKRNVMRLNYLRVGTIILLYTCGVDIR